VRAQRARVRCMRVEAGPGWLRQRMRAAAGREVRTSGGDQAGQGPGGPSREREKKGRARPCELEGRAVGRAGPWEGRSGPCGPSGERERDRAEPVHTNSNPLWPVSGRTQRREHAPYSSE
jgi:hypothetical protein